MKSRKTQFRDALRVGNETYTSLLPWDAYSLIEDFTFHIPIPTATVYREYYRQDIATTLAESKLRTFIERDDLAALAGNPVHNNDLLTEIVLAAYLGKTNILAYLLDLFKQRPELEFENDPRSNRAVFLAVYAGRVDCFNLLMDRYPGFIATERQRLPAKKQWGPPFTWHNHDLYVYLKLAARAAIIVDNADMLRVILELAKRLKAYTPKLFRFYPTKADINYLFAQAIEMGSENAQCLLLDKYNNITINFIDLIIIHGLIKNAALPIFLMYAFNFPQYQRKALLEETVIYYSLKYCYLDLLKVLLAVGCQIGSLSEKLQQKVPKELRGESAPESAASSATNPRSRNAFGRLFRTHTNDQQPSITPRAAREPK